MSTLRANMLFVALGLALLGNVMIYSATSADYGAYYLLVRFVHLIAGLAAFFLVSRVRYTSWRRYSPALYIAVLASLALVLVPGIGEQVGGARRWFDLGVMSVQPAEFAKLAAVLLLSCLVARVRPGSGLPYRVLLLGAVLPTLVIAEPDFGTSAVIVAGIVGVLWASELRTRDLLVTGGLALTAMVGIMLAEPYRRARVLTFLDPWSASDGAGYQVVQSMVAIRAGDLFGAGAGGGGRSVTVPEIQTDMIFALIGEELGLLGMLAVIGAFFFLVMAGYRVAFFAPSVLGRCIASGIATMIAVQAVFNIGASMAVIPLSGMTLPFISYGGSSVVVCFASVGILWRISKDSERARGIEPRRISGRAAPHGYDVQDSGGDSRRRYGRARDSRIMRGG